MSHFPITPEERFAMVVGELLNYPGVTPPLEGAQAKKRFGATSLKVHDKIFAMLSKGRRVVKLPAARVDALVISGDGERFDPRRDGRPMKEWIVIEPSSEEDWLLLAQEAMEFVAAIATS